MFLPRIEPLKYTASPAQLPNQMAELRQQEFLERETARVGRAGQGHDDPAARDPHLRARQHRCTADLLVGEHPEQFTEARQALVEHRLHRFERRVARGPGWSGRMQPGLAGTTAAGPVSSTWFTLRASSRAAISGCVRL